MTVAIVQTKETQTATTLSVSVTLDATPTNGNYLIATYRESQIPTSITLPTDWVWATGSPLDLSSRRAGIAYKRVNGDSATVTISSDTTDTKSICVEEVSGLAASSVLDKHAESANGPTATTKQPGSTGTLSNADSYAVALVSSPSSFNGSEAVDSGFTLKQIRNTMLSASKVTAATTALNPTFSWATSRSTYAMIATFVGSTTEEHSGNVDLSGSGTQTRSGTPKPTGTLALSGSGSLTLAGSPSIPGSRTGSGEGTLSFTPSLVTQSGTRAGSGSGTLTLTPQAPIVWQGDGLSAQTFTDASEGTDDTPIGSVVGTAMEVIETGNRAPRIQWVGGDTAYGVWAHDATDTAAWRWYNEFADPVDGCRIALAWEGSQAAWYIDMASDGSLGLFSEAGLIEASGAGLITSGVNYRFEVTLSPDGYTELRVYNSHSDSALEIIGGFQDPVTAQEFWWGTTFSTSRGDAYGDDLQINWWTDELIGPSVLPFLGSLSLSGSGTLSLAGSATPTGSVSLSGTGALTRSGTPKLTGSIALSGAGSLSLSGVPKPRGTLTLAGSGQLTLSGVPKPHGSKSLSGSGQLTLAGTITALGELDLSGEGTLTFLAGEPQDLDITPGQPHFVWAADAEFEWSAELELTWAAGPATF